MWQPLKERRIVLVLLVGSSARLGPCHFSIRKDPPAVCKAKKNKAKLLSLSMPCEGDQQSVFETKEVLARGPSMHTIALSLLKRKVLAADLPMAWKKAALEGRLLSADKRDHRRTTIAGTSS